MMRLSAIGCVFLIAAFGAPLDAFASSADSLKSRFQELRGHRLTGVSGAPLYVRSSTGGDRLSADVYSIIDQPFRALADQVARPSSWCDFVPLTLNVKACTYQGVEPAVLTFYVGRKEFQPPDDAYQLSYRFRETARTPEYLGLELRADDGPLGTSAYRIELEAVDYMGRTLIRIHSSYEPSWRSEMATSLYLTTLGRNKVGFTLRKEQGRGQVQYVGGVEGIVERNVMRYYLALQTYLETRKLPREERFEARIKRWFQLTERHAKQLHELDREQYLSAKRRERSNQRRLQSRMSARTEAVASN